MHTLNKYIRNGCKGLKCHRIWAVKTALSDIFNLWVWSSKYQTPYHRKEWKKPFFYELFGCNREESVHTCAYALHTNKANRFKIQTKRKKYRNREKRRRRTHAYKQPDTFPLQIMLEALSHWAKSQLIESKRERGEREWERERIKLPQQNK